MTTGYANVLDFGAVSSTSRTESHDARNTAAFRKAAATGRTVFVPPGIYYGSYDLDVNARPSFVGTDAGNCVIAIADGHHFLDANRSWSSLYVAGLRFDGGAGAVRNRFTRGNVTELHLVECCTFVDYTRCAIAHDSSDMPLWKIDKCLFRAAGQTGTIGVALSGLTDGNSITDCEWQRNQIHVKLGRGGNNAALCRNDFVQYSAAVPGLHRAMIWVVPSATFANSGNGCTVDLCKFGNENLGRDDYRLLYADEQPGPHFGERLPALDADSAGFVTGHRVRDCFVGGSGEFANSFVYTTTPNLQGFRIGDLQMAGNTPDYLLRFRTTPEAARATESSQGERADNVIGPIQYSRGGMKAVRASNSTVGVHTVNYGTGTGSLQVL